MMKLIMISRKLHLQKKLTVQQKLLYLKGLPEACIYSARDIVKRLPEVIGSNRYLLDQFTFDQAALRDQTGNHKSI